MCGRICGSDLQPDDNKFRQSATPQEPADSKYSNSEQGVSEFSGLRDRPSYCSRCGLEWSAFQKYCASCGYQSLEKVDAGVLACGIPVARNDACNSNRNFSSGTGCVTWGGGQIILGIIAVVLALFSAAMVASLLGSVYPDQESAVATWVSVHLMFLGIVVTVWYFGLRHTRYPLAVLRLGRIQRPKKSTVFMMLGVLSTSLIATSIYAGIVDALGWGILTPPEIESEIIFNGPFIFLTFQALAFVTPLSEEIFFRGFVFRGLVPKIGPWMAIVVSACVFSVFHINFAVMIPIFITGLLFAWLYWRTGSLWASIGAHAGQNALANGFQALST